jgi:hypothetical protein
MNIRSRLEKLERLSMQCRTCGEPLRCLTCSTRQEDLNVDMNSLSNEQLIRVVNGEPLSSVRGRDRKPS